MRGKVDRAARVAEDDGITPACAGKSKDDAGVYGRVEDHPRVCGEK